MIKGINLTKLKIFLKKLPKALARRPLLALFAFIFLALVLAVLVFYQLYLLPQRSLAPFEERPLQFEEGLCQKFLDILEQREIRFEQTGSKSYPDPFWPQSLLEGLPLP